MPDAQGRPLVAGAVLREQIDVLESVAGKEAVTRALAALPDAHRDALSVVTAVSWVSLDATNELIENVAREVGRDPLDLNRECTRIGVERTLKSLWRVLLRFTSDNALITRAPIFYSKNYDSGRLVAHLTDRGAAEIVLDGWPEPPPRMDVEGIGTAITTILECAGRRDVQMSWRRERDGARYQVRWAW
jgi:hypothetical protein